jgi:hypothetical protein
MLFVRNTYDIYNRLCLFLDWEIFDQLGAVTHACNPSYSGGGDGEDPHLRSVRQKV